ncbi:type 1 glutamine amidotransferase [Pseudoclavibacter sp. 13-3]|uniref:type 1 glutamine amidotransferase n=1 Tax=Pseudoclavibacter sp. 13-3 TaxID=2901228 RepID=UPI001E39C03E|nr:glutamine amidotransferase [Pseudoclavibacter sp. 13-3]MCD7102184.1 glutamine amidotransferase [Pseudoclavibacter sp. 13-3]
MAEPTKTQTSKTTEAAGATCTTELLLYREEIALLWSPRTAAPSESDAPDSASSTSGAATADVPTSGPAAATLVHRPFRASFMDEPVTSVTPGSDIGRPVDILQLYPDEMNIYGDWGNTLTLVRRLEWMGFVPRVHDLHVGGPLPRRADIVVGGGGQDSGQAKVYRDLLERQQWVQTMVEIGTPMLLVCGMYQLFGRSFDTIGGQQLQGIGVLDVHTKGESERLVGNVVVESEQFGTIIGFENHSGQTFLGDGVQPLGTVRSGHGAGNNGRDGTEGARVANVVGTYLHGSVLPKNPRLADYLIGAALANRYGMMRVPEVDDPFVDQARAVALTRPR